jgi:tripartite-type tricarboxylate transporter receptor subunit TctC
MTRWLSLFTALGCLPFATVAHAQTYPSKTVTIVVTAAAGGVTDTVARAIGQRLSEKWGQQIVIENKGGGAHIVGAQMVASAKPDGHTLMLAEAGTYVVNPNLYPKSKMPVEIMRDFIPITALVRIHHALIASPKFAPDSVADLIKMAREKPGTVTYGTAGIGSGPHVNVARLENTAKIKMLPVHYRGATPAMNDVMGGHTNMMLIAVSSALPHFRADKVKMLGIGSPKRLAKVPDVPTIAEGGNLPGFLAGTWFGLAVTAGTPRPIVDKISIDVRAVMGEPAFKERFLDRLMYEAVDSSPEEFQQFIREETQNWAKVIDEQNLKLTH